MDKTQGENIFHSTCLVEGKVYSLIVDGRSCTSVSSRRLIENLGFTPPPPPSSPQVLQIAIWLSENGELIVEKQVLLTFSIGKYVDEVLCDVAPMEVSHILLGRTWQYDREVVHNYVSNEFTCVHKGCKVIP